MKRIKAIPVPRLYVYSRGVVRTFDPLTGEPIGSSGRPFWNVTTTFQFTPTAVHDGYFKAFGHPDAEAIMELEPRAGAKAL